MAIWKLFPVILYNLQQILQLLLVFRQTIIILLYQENTSFSYVVYDADIFEDH